VTYYTVAQANALLPELTRLLTELRAEAQQLASLQGRVAVLKDKVRKNGYHNPAEDTMVASVSEGIQEAIGMGITQLSNWGIELKDLNTGLVDFPALYEGRTVFLCWQLDEPEVSFWHETDAGFAGRQPIDDTFD
jgi:hypothetical protein